MRDAPTHDALYRLSERYAADAIANEEVATLMAAHYRQLASLITDDLTAEVFQVAYCRITHRYHGGDFVKCFRHIFWSTMTDYQHRTNEYNSRRHAIPQETKDPEGQAD